VKPRTSKLSPVPKKGIKNAKRTNGISIKERNKTVLIGSLANQIVRKINAKKPR
jgi:hypothetical protein